MEITLDRSFNVVTTISHLLYIFTVDHFFNFKSKQSFYLLFIIANISYFAIEYNTIKMLS